MADDIGTVDMNIGQVFSQTMTLEVKVHVQGVRLQAFRLRLACWLIILARAVGGFKRVDVVVAEDVS